MNPAAPVMTTRFFIQSPVVRTLDRYRSVGMLVEKALEHRQPHDFEIEADRPVLDVIEVVLDPLLDRGVAAPPVDLRPAGDAGLDLVPEHVLGNLVLELGDEQRALRPRAD